MISVMIEANHVNYFKLFDPKHLSIYCAPEYKLIMIIKCMNNYHEI